MRPTKLRSEDRDCLIIFCSPDKNSIAEYSKSEETCSVWKIPICGHALQHVEKETFYNQVQIPENLNEYIPKQANKIKDQLVLKRGPVFQKSNLNKCINIQGTVASPLKKSKLNYIYNKPNYSNPVKILLENKSNSNFNDDWNTFENISQVELQELIDKGKHSSYDFKEEFRQKNCANYCLVNNYEKRKKGGQLNSNSIFTISCTIKPKSELNKQKSGIKFESIQKSYGENIWRRDYEVYYFHKPSNKINLRDEDSDIAFSCSSSSSSSSNKPVVVNYDNSAVSNKEKPVVNNFPENFSNENPESVKQVTRNTEVSDKCPDEKSFCNNVCKKSGDCLNAKAIDLSKDNNSLRKEYVYNIKFIRPTKPLSEVDLQSKSQESSTSLTTDKSNLFHTQLYVCPCQTNSDINQKKNCKLTSELSPTSESQTMCDKKENTDWNQRLSVILGCINSKKRDIETVTINSESSCKKTCTNPNIKSQLIDSVPCSKSNDNVLPNVIKEEKTNDVAPGNTNTKNCKRSSSMISMKGDKIFITKVPCSCPKPEPKGDSPTPKCQSPMRKCVESPPKSPSIPKCETPPPICAPVPTYEIPPPTYEDPPPCNSPPPKTEDPIPKCSLKDNEKIQCILKSHCEAMATIKCAMQDVVCKAFVASSEAASAAATVIRSESAKQFEKIKNFELPKDEVTCPSPSSKIKIPCKRCQPKDCNNETDLSSTLLARPIDNSEDNDEEYIPLPKKIVDEIANKVGSAVMMIRENVDLTEFLKPRTLNDDSSEYDVPAKPFKMKNKPDNVSNLIDNGVSTSGNALFKNFTNKILLMFSDKENKCTSGQSSISSETTSDGEDNDDDEKKPKK